MEQRFIVILNFDPQSGEILRIRLTDEELAEFIPIGFDYVCNPNYECIETVIVHGECGKQRECLMKWLKDKVE